MTYTPARGDSTESAWGDKRPATAAGTEFTTILAANAPGSVTVNFPTGRFSVVPCVEVTPYVNAPGTIVSGVAVYPITTIGCTLWVTTAVAGTYNITLGWVAVEPG